LSSFSSFLSFLSFSNFWLTLRLRRDFPKTISQLKKEDVLEAINHVVNVMKEGIYIRIKMKFIADEVDEVNEVDKNIPSKVVESY
jgi:hypothetical protein